MVLARYPWSYKLTSSLFHRRAVLNQCLFVSRLSLTLGRRKLKVLFVLISVLHCSARLNSLPFWSSHTFLAISSHSYSGILGLVRKMAFRECIRFWDTVLELQALSSKIWKNLKLFVKLEFLFIFNYNNCLD